MNLRAEVLNGGVLSNEKRYANLLVKTLPRVIHTEAENQRCIAELKAIDRLSLPNAEQERLAELLTLLIESFEEKKYSFSGVTPTDVVHHLMEANQLRQSDMVDVFGSPSIASEVLNGKRRLAKMHIQKLARKFHVSPALFFES